MHIPNLSTIPNNPLLEEGYIEGNEFKIVGNRKLNSLILSRNKFGGKGITALNEMLKVLYCAKSVA